MNEYNTNAPMATPPQPPMFQQQSQQQNKSRGCFVGGAIAVGIVGFMMFAFIFMVGIFASVADVANDSIKEISIDDEFLNSQDKIAIIDIKGVIGGKELSAELVISELRKAQNDDDVKAIILDMNTPGGEVTASDEIHHEIQKFRKTGRKVITCMHSMGASGGYLIAAGTDHIIANKVTLTGSFGVIMSTYNYAKLLDKIGVQAVTYKSGNMKDFLSGSRVRTPQEQKKMDDMVQTLIKEDFHEFGKIIAAGRSHYKDLDAILAAEFADGRVLSGQQALDFKLIDQLGYFEDAISYARKNCGASNARLVHYQRPPNIAKLLFGAKAKTTIVPLFSAELLDIKPGRKYYILPSVLP